METPNFLNRELTSVHQELNVPIPDPVVVNSHDSPVTKKAKYDITPQVQDGTKVMALLNGPVPCNKSLCELIHLVKPHIRQLVEDSNLVSYFFIFNFGLRLFYFIIIILSLIILFCKR